MKFRTPFILCVTLFTLQIFLTKSSNSTGCHLKKYQKEQISQGNQLNHSLFVSAFYIEPYMYRNAQSHFDGGIEYKLIKTIAEKERFDLVVDDQRCFSRFRQMRNKFSFSLNFSISGKMFTN